MERYTRILSIQNSLFQEECPLIFDKGALLKDNKSQSNILQLQFKNIGLKSIVAVYIQIECYDIEDQKLDCIQFNYLDLNVNYGGTFGSDVGIGISQSVARRFQFLVSKIFFNDKSVTDYSGKMKSLDRSTPVDSLGALKAQFERDINRIMPDVNCVLCPTDNNQVWYCTCGSINYKDNFVCGMCKIDKSRLFAIFDIKNLKQNNLKYLEDTEKERKKKEEEKKELERKRREIAKKILISACGILLLLGISLWLTDRYVLPQLKYSKAMSFEEKQYYEEAIELYSELGEYKDSISRKGECAYNLLKEKFAAGEYGFVIDILSTLDDSLYEDVDMMEKYLRAKILYMQESYDEALNIFEELGDYSDSKEQVSEVKYRMALQLYQKKSYNEAYELLDGTDIKADSDETVELWKNCGEVLGDIKFAEGDYEEAAKYYREVKNMTKLGAANTALTMEPIAGEWEGMVWGYPTEIRIMLDGTWTYKMGNSKPSSIVNLSYSTATDSWVTGYGTVVYLRDGYIEVKGYFNGDTYQFTKKK